MKFSVSTGDASKAKSDLMMVLVNKEFEKDQSFKSLDKKLGSLLTQLLKRESFEGKWGQSKVVVSHKKIPAIYAGVFGLGAKDKIEYECLRKAGGRISKIASQLKTKKITLGLKLGNLALKDSTKIAQALGEGIILATYEFLRYKKKSKNSFHLEEVSFIVDDSKKISFFKKGFEKAQVLGAGIFLARDLINTTANHMTPMELAKSARGLRGVRTRILGSSEIKRLKMGSYLGVAQGSKNPPAFIEMHYKPQGKPKTHVAFVGKGITFDSGGLSLKPPKQMETMKDDMSGAAAVIGLMSVISRLAPKVSVWGYVAAAENMPDASAIRPGDIITSMKGKTIEVLNTDAEGRLTLIDAMTYAQKRKPVYMIDCATLTGACLVALGDRISGIMGNDEKLIESLIACGKDAGEKMWQLPLAEDYKDELKSPIADYKNVGAGYGGTITAGLFLQEFVEPKVKWAHIDIAGPSWSDKPRDYESIGGTGVLVRTYAEFLERLSK